MLVICVSGLRLRRSFRLRLPAAPALAGTRPAEHLLGAMPKFLSIGRDLSPRLRWYVLVTIVAGVPVVAGAVWAAAAETPGTRTMIGVWLFFVLALLAEWRPVPIDIEGKR